MSQSGTLKNFQIKAVEILERYHRIIGEFKEQSNAILAISDKVKEVQRQYEELEAQANQDIT